MNDAIIVVFGTKKSTRGLAAQVSPHFHAEEISRDTSKHE